jgi:hypothetical protein
VDALVSLISGVNTATNAIGWLAFGWLGFVPAEVSITILSAVIGVLLLLLFKHTSNQKAIGRVRDAINADLLAIKLFRDSISVALASQARLFVGSLKLLVYSIVPMLIMIVPVSLILAQMGLWYQARPFGVGDAITVKLEIDRPFNNQTPITLESAPGVQTLVGPVRVYSKNEVYWKLKAVKRGEHRLVFRVGDGVYDKRLAVGDGLMRLSLKKPGAHFFDVLLYPLEKPFSRGSSVGAITLFYPDSDSIISGTNYWIVYFFVVSMVFAFLFKPVLKVRI